MTGGVPYRHIVDGCFAEASGGGGLERLDYEAVLAETEPALDALRRWREAGSHPFLTLPAASDDLPALETAARRHHEAFDTVVVLGTGGSSLGGRCLTALAQPTFPGLQDGPRVYFMENVDPHGFDELLRAVDLSSTGFIAISKSGATAETLAQFLVCHAALGEAVDADRLARHVTVITGPGPSPLRHMAQNRGMAVIDHDPALGGRYAALSVVGLLPAMIAGIDAVAVREGAAAVLDAALAAASPADSAPAVGAAIAIGLQRRRGVTTTVLMPYCDRLVPFGRWFRQLWAESLGKDGKGTTPVCALGTVDQHSQLQLYLDGPADKMFTLIALDPVADDPPIAPDASPEGELDWLIGRSMGELLAASLRATAATLTARGRPVRSFRLAKLDARAMGAMMMHFMLETVIAAELLGVDPFSQPAVEESKRLTRKYMSALPPRARV